jgi:hypothetical protein
MRPPAAPAPLLLTIALATFAIASPLFAKKGLNEGSRIQIIRGISSEVVVAKVALPRGKHGLYLNSQGKIDQQKLANEMKVNGAAIRAGMPVEITKVTFKPDELVLEINHGGKSGKKWYQHIEMGVGGTTTPVGPQDAPVLAYGSYIDLTLPIGAPTLTADQVKKMLAPVLDFDRHAPTVLYSPSLPPKTKAAIEKHEVLVGMDRDAVLSSKGPPDRKVRETRDGDEQEDWIYGAPPHSLFVTFSGDTVIKVKQY